MPRAELVGEPLAIAVGVVRTEGTAAGNLREAGENGAVVGEGVTLLRKRAWGKFDDARATRLWQVIENAPQLSLGYDDFQWLVNHDLDLLEADGVDTSRAIDRLASAGRRVGVDGRPLPGRLNIVITRQPGWQAEAGAGSFGRISSSLGYGVAGEDAALYTLLQTEDENGWRDYSQSRLRQLFTRASIGRGDSGADLSITAADNKDIINTAATDALSSLAISRAVSASADRTVRVWSAARRHSLRCRNFGVIRSAQNSSRLKSQSGVVRMCLLFSACCSLRVGWERSTRVLQSISILP